MIEVKFRGKIKYNGNYLFSGDWAFGSLILKSKGAFIYVIEKDNFDNIIREYEVEVIPESVEQFTGLKDKNEVEIFEKQIFKFKFLKELHNPIELTGYFTFGEDLSFEIDVLKNKEYICLKYISNGVFYDFELTGENAFDNPELLNK